MTEQAVPADRTLRPETRRYEASGVVVSYESRVCLHVGECVRGLPSVFDVTRRPWIDAGAEAPEAVAEVIRRCPSGALQYHLAQGDDEEPERPTAVRRQEDGSLVLRGDLTLISGGRLRRETRAVLCGCGVSANLPFCDHGGRCGQAA